MTDEEREETDGQGRLIAIGDVHGCSTALAALIEAIGPRRDDTIVTLGDYIDWGPDSRGVLDLLIGLSDRCHLVPLRVGTVDEYGRALERLLKGRPIDATFLAMAASDYAPEPVAGKISSDSDALTIRCVRQPKVIQHVRDWSPSTFLVGFKLLSGAPTEELIRQAEIAVAAHPPAGCPSAP